MAASSQNGSRDKSPAPRDLREEALADATLPEPVRRALASGMKLERITLDSEGRWFHEGGPIEHPRIVDLFDRSIERTPGGTFVLHVAPFTYPIEVEDAPLQVRQIELEGEPPASVRLWLSDGSEETLDPKTLRYVPERGFYCQVKDGLMTARFSRPAYYKLAEHVDEVDGSYILRLGSTGTHLAQ